MIKYEEIDGTGLPDIRDSRVARTLGAITSHVLVSVLSLPMFRKPVGDVLGNGAQRYFGPECLRMGVDILGDIVFPYVDTAQPFMEYLLESNQLLREGQTGYVPVLDLLEPTPTA